MCITRIYRTISVLYTIFYIVTRVYRDGTRIGFKHTVQDRYGPFTCYHVYRNSDGVRCDERGADTCADLLVHGTTIRSSPKTTPIYRKRSGPIIISNDIMDHPRSLAAADNCYVFDESFVTAVPRFYHYIYTRVPVKPVQQIWH